MLTPAAWERRDIRANGLDPLHKHLLKLTKLLNKEYLSQSMLNDACQNRQFRLAKILLLNWEIHLLIRN